MRLRNYMAFTMMIILLSCKKEETTTAVVQDGDLLTSHPWRPYKSTVGQGTTNYFQDCDLDNLIYFKTDGVFVRNNGTNWCSNTTSQEMTYTYIFEKENNYLFFNGSKSDTVFVVKLTEDTLKYKSKNFFDVFSYTTLIK